MNRPEQHFRARLAVLLTGGALIAALFPMAGVALAAVPAAPPQPDLAAASDTGISPTDNITKTLNGLVFTGTAEAGSTLVTIYVGGSTAIGTAVPNLAGAYSVTTTTAIPDNTVNNSITAKATNGSGEGPASSALLVTTDNTPPTVTNVTSSTANGTYAAGTVIPITVTFDEVVWVTGTPQLALATGSPSSTSVGYTSGNGTNTLTFTYTVAAGNASADLDYASTSALSGTIADTAGNAATLTLAAPGAAGSLGANKAIVIDTSGPTVTINQAGAQADPTKTAPISFTVVFTQDVGATFTTGDVTLGGTAGGTLVGTVTGSGTTYNVAVTGMTTSGTVIASLAAGVASSSGHPSAASTSSDNTVTWDVTPPTVTINQAVGQADPTGTTPINFTVIFSEPVTNFATGDVTLTASTAGGSKTATVTGSGTTYNVAVTGMTTAGTVVATVAAGVATDAAGNANLVSTSSDNTVSWDPSAGPTVTINQASGQADPTAAAPINFTVTFSAPVTGFDSTDVTLTSTAGSVYAVVTGGTSVYNVAVYGMSVSGTVTATIAADRAVSISGNHPSQASTSTDNTVSFRVASKFLVTSSNYAPVPGSAVTITAQLADSLNNAVPAAGIVVTWSSTNGGSFFTATSTTNTSGIATVTFTVSTTTAVVHTVTATGGGFTGTSAAITTTARPAQITLTPSASVITWAKPVVLTIHFGTLGSLRPFTLQVTRDMINWQTVPAALTTDAAGNATYSYRPATNLYYRVSYAGATDLSAAFSNIPRVVVRQIALLRPTSSGAVRTVVRNTSVTFTTTVRPVRADLAPARVTFVFYRLVNGRWTLSAKRDVFINSLGLARYTWKFSTSGAWYVRSIVNPTPANANSVWSPVERYNVN